MRISTILFFLWIAFLFLFVFPIKVYGETKTTTNILPPITSFSHSGTTDGAGGTGASPGGTYTYTVPLSQYLTKEQINAGFTLNYSVTVLSHYSNLYVPSCTSGITNGGVDCKDIVNITLSIFDNGVLVKRFENTYILDYGGYRTYSLNNNVDPNNFANPYATLQLYGVDTGFCCGMFGPKFSNPIMTLTYQIIEQIVSSTNNTTATIAQNISSPSNPLSPTNSTNQSPPSDTHNNTSLSPIAPLSPVAQNQQHQQGQHVDVQIDRHSDGETATVTVSGPDRGPESFTIQMPPAPGSQSQQSSQTEGAKDNMKTAGTKEGATSIANKILDAIKDTFDPSNQATKVALMAMIATEYKDRDLQDAAKWYEDKEIYGNKELNDPYNRLFSLAQDKMMDKLIGIQYGEK